MGSVRGWGVSRQRPQDSQEPGEDCLWRDLRDSMGPNSSFSPSDPLLKARPWDLREDMFPALQELSQP